MKLDFDEMMELCDKNEEFKAKEEIVDGIKVTIFSYMVQYQNTFDTELAKEFRGTTFRNDTKECICRPLPKFFNVNETEETQEHLLDLDNAEYYIKYDGSMITPVIINGKVFLKTKKSFYSDVAIQAQKFYDKNFKSVNWLLREDITDIFEYVAPSNRIVLEYDTEQLIHLGSRCIKTGNFCPSLLSRVKDVKYQDIYDMKGIEGFVIHTNGKMVKAKTKEYIDNHKIVTNFNPKNIIQAILDDTIDDMIGVLSQLGFDDRRKEVEELRDEVNHKKIEILNEITRYWSSFFDHSQNRKEFALAVNELIPTQYRGIMFLLWDGKDIVDKVNKLVYDEYKGD